MEQPLKLMASTSSTTSKRSTERFSNLPDHIAHHILSFLTMTDLALLSMASKRCRELCMSIPVLTFDAMQYKNWPKRVHFMNFLDRFIILRNGMETRRFCIRWCFEGGHDSEEFRVLTWLHSAVRCNIELLDLEFILETKGKIFLLPLYVFRCESLTSLNVNLHKGILKLPSSSGFTMLRSLSLRSVLINSESFGEWVSSFCKFLKELRLELIGGIKNITIASSSLESFKLMLPSDLCHLNVSGEILQLIAVMWKFDSSSGKSFRVCAPNLKHFGWTGNPTNDNYLGSLMHLKGAGLLLIPEVDTHQNFGQILCSVRCMKRLILNDQFIKVLFKQGCLPTSFLNNLVFLVICTSSLSDDIVPAITALLSGTPNLKSLYIRSYPPFVDTNARNSMTMTSSSSLEAFGFTAAYWESQNLMFIHQLKTAKIELFNKGGNELELVRYLLKHGRVLKQMGVSYSPPFPSDIGRKVNEFDKASSAEVAFYRR